MNLTKLSAFFAMLTISGCSELEEGTPDAGSTTTDVGSPAVDVGMPPRDDGQSMRLDTGSPVTSCNVGEGSTCVPGQSPPNCCAAGFNCATREGAGNVCCRGAGSACSGDRGCCGSLECRGGVCATAAPSCTLSLGSECMRNASAPACCPSNTICGAQNDIVEAEFTCCHSNAGNVCSLKADCCGSLECVNGRCIVPVRGNSCDPAATVNNGCPRDAPYCFVGTNTPVPTCYFVPRTGGNRQTGQSCTGNNECALGNF